ncbi:kynureninase [Stackebrandtia endophytica]|uniref:Kynureninase n=2 Tax=Stackebrandtia endophytica TaxID=1496996 RepID=A0A543ASK5_9ACTN|nr:kynureninase [Stackebrandtia endophytica]
MMDDMSAHQSVAAALDAADPLSTFADRFSPGPDGVIYLDGNSLGRPPKAVQAAVRDLMEREWPTDLIQGWDRWIDLPTAAGDLLGEAVLGARPGEVLVCDSTSVNLYKLAAAALDAAPAGRRVLITDNDNFPTDRYILEGIAHSAGARFQLIDTDIDEGVDPGVIADAIGDDTALVCLSHVAYRSGALADMRAVTEIVHAAGGLVLWDLCHSAGSVDIDLTGDGVDLAVGCTYKYLNAGPGAPAFLYVRRELQQRLRQPIWGWFSQADQFAMGQEYRPHDGINRFAVGTPSIPGVVAVKAAVELVAEAGIAAIRAKSLQMVAHAHALCEEQLAPLGFRVATPTDPQRRGGHLTLHHERAWQISQAMRKANVIPDYRAPDRIRLGFAPLYNSFSDIDEAVERIATIVRTEAHLSFSAQPSRVT